MFAKEEAKMMREYLEGFSHYWKREYVDGYTWIRALIHSEGETLLDEKISCPWFIEKHQSSKAKFTLSILVDDSSFQLIVKTSDTGASCNYTFPLDTSTISNIPGQTEILKRHTTPFIINKI